MEQSETDRVILIVGVCVSAVVAFFLFLYVLRDWAQGGQFTKKFVRIDGKVVILTGASCSLGRQTALEIARRGGRIYLACKNREEGEEVRQLIVQETGSNHVFSRLLDLASFDSIRNFVRKFNEDESRLDVLILNASVFAIPRRETENGFEMHLGVNHLGHFLLTRLLLDRLHVSAPSRIIVATSSVYAWGNIDQNDLNGEKKYSKYKAYYQSKLANVLFVREMARRLEGTAVTINAAHPGHVNTDLKRCNVMVRCLIWPLSYLFTKTPANGAQTLIALALDPEFEKTTGKYFVDCKPEEVKPAGKDELMGEWLFKMSEKLTGLREVSNQARRVSNYV